MKTTLWTIMLLCAINNISAQVKSQVKESFELTSIAFRLAGAEEYITLIPQHFDLTLFISS